MCSHNSFAPPPHAGHQPGHFLLWDSIPFLNEDILQVSQRGCVGHSKTYSTPKLIPQMFNWVEVWTHGRPVHPVHSHILEVGCNDPGSVGASVVILEDGVRSHILKVWDRHWPQDLIAISDCVEVSPNDDKVCLPSYRDATPHHDTAPTESCHSICAAICKAFSLPSPHSHPAIQRPQTEP